MQAVYRRVGKAVRAFRTEKGWSQDVLAEKAGLHRAHVGEIERGETNVTLQTLYILAQTFGIKIEDILRGI